MQEIVAITLKTAVVLRACLAFLAQQREVDGMLESALFWLEYLRKRYTLPVASASVADETS